MDRNEYKYDEDYFKAALKRANMTIHDIRKLLGISQPGMYKKSKGGLFDLAEVFWMLDILGGVAFEDVFRPISQKEKEERYIKVRSLIEKYLDGRWKTVTETSDGRIIVTVKELNKISDEVKNILLNNNIKLE